MIVTVLLLLASYLPHTYSICYFLFTVPTQEQPSTSSTTTRSALNTTIFSFIGIVATCAYFLQAMYSGGGITTLSTTSAVPSITNGAAATTTNPTSTTTSTIATNTTTPTTSTTTVTAAQWASAQAQITTLTQLAETQRMANVELRSTLCEMRLTIDQQQRTIATLNAEIGSYQLQPRTSSSTSNIPRKDHRE